MKLSDSDKQSLFWDTDYKSLDKDKHAEYIISRILEKGNISNVKSVFLHYGEEKIGHIVQTSRQISPKTAIFWKTVLNIKEPIRCLEKNYRKQRKKHWGN